MKNLIFLLLLFCTQTLSAQQTYKLNSPDGRLSITVTAAGSLTYAVALDGQELLNASPLSMTLDNGTTWGTDARLKEFSRTSVDEQVPSPFYRAAQLRDHYNALTLRSREGWDVEFRAYDDGAAYRFISRLRKPFCVVNEQVNYNFPEDLQATVPYVRDQKGCIDEQFFNSFENTYTSARLSQLDPQRLIFLPIVADAEQGVKLCITETDLTDYPGLYLRNADGKSSLSGVFAPYPRQLVQAGHNNLQMIVTEREDYIARVDAPRTFPWRVTIVAQSDAQLAASTLSYLLAAPSRIEDTSWIKPGKVAWEWWNDWNLAGVDFRAGINTETYKYYIDFAAAKGIEYVILDEGWAVNMQADLMQVVPEIDLRQIVDYGASKGVGVILWAGFQAFDRDMENVCRHYSAMGVKGFKVDFMDRDDQQMTAFNHRAAQTAARYKLLLDLHGTHKPAGLNRTWPNVLNFEGVHGLEQMKWSPASVDQVTYDVLIPFIRQVSGPVDYTQGAMRNATRSNYHPCGSEPMSQGTRCRQLALYVVLESPLNMLCDSPTNYLREQESTAFIAAIPTVWDQTLILAAKMGEYIVTARRMGNTWYVGGITDWTARDLEIDLSFLGEGTHEAMLFRDGVNADRNASDYKLETLRVNTSQPLRIHLAPGGGFAARIAAPAN